MPRAPLPRRFRPQPWTVAWALLGALGIAGACTAPEELEAELEAAAAVEVEVAEPADVDVDVVENGENADAVAELVDAERSERSEAPEEAHLPETTLPLTLLATVAARDPERSAATIRDERDGTIRNLQIGDRIDPATTLAAVGRARVVLRHDGEDQRLEIPRISLRIDDPIRSFSEAPDADDPGVLRQGIQLGFGPHHAIKNPDHAWGERATIAAIQRALATYGRSAGGGPKVHIGDLSRRGGGPFAPHLSHRSGRDVDVGYVLQGPEADELRFRSADRHNLDVARTWALLDAFIATGVVRVIFVDRSIQRLLYDYARELGVDEETLSARLQYPRGEGSSGGLIRHWRGHRNHFHVRFGPPRSAPNDAAAEVPDGHDGHDGHDDHDDHDDHEHIADEPALAD